MLQKLNILLILLISYSCATNRKKLNISSLKKKVCLNIDGKMRLETDGQKYVADLQIKTSQNSTLVGINVPIFGEYIIELIYDNKGRLVKSRGINILLQSFNSSITKAQLNYERSRLINVLSLWKKLHTSLNMKKSSNKRVNFAWEEGPESNELLATVRKGKYENKLMVHFFDLNKYFTRQTIYYSPSEDFQTKVLNKVKVQSQNGMILEAFVRECLDEVS
ncbi:hypothetical protein N9N67_03370 [Bacteriovoracaceae bacterium]|nr:hypothetical protein [Bacteriovoracaceae bacterium]